MTKEFESYLRYELRRSPHTVEAYLREVKEFAGWLCGDSKPEFCPDSVTVNDIRGWLHVRARRGAAPASLRRSASALRAYFRFICRQHVRTDNPAEEITPIKAPKKLPDFVRAEEMKATLSETTVTDEDTPFTEVRNKLIIELLYATGIRQAELLGINDSDISSDGRELRVTGKRNKQRVLPLPDSLYRKIRHWQQLRDDTYSTSATNNTESAGTSKGDTPLFRTVRGRMSKATLYNIVNRELAEVHSGKKSPHVLRHTFATAMLNGGSDLNDVKEFLGHSTLATTQIYTHVSFADLQKTYSTSHPRAKKK